MNTAELYENKIRKHLVEGFRAALRDNKNRSFGYTTTVSTILADIAGSLSPEVRGLIEQEFIACQKEVLTEDERVALLAKLIARAHGHD